MSEHPTMTVIESFVLGALPDPDTERFVAHVSACDRCSLALAREARLETALLALPAAPSRNSRLRRGLMMSAPVVVLAAAAVLLLVRRTADVARPDPSVAAEIGSAPVPPDADEVVAKLRPSFRKCYESALATDPNAAGKVVIEAIVQASGTVESTAVVSNDGLPSSTASCLEGVVRGARFTPSGERTAVRVPVTFTRR